MNVLDDLRDSGGRADAFAKAAKGLIHELAANPMSYASCTSEAGVVHSSFGERSLPKRDMYYTVVKEALIKDGWTITHDPILSTELGRAIREDYELSILVFDITQEIIRQWLP